MKILETGDIAYYPDIFNPSGQPMEIIGRRKLKYPSGSKFYQYFIEGHGTKTIEHNGKKIEVKGLTDRLVENMKENVANDYDNLVIICGAEGVGKSNMAVDLCKSYDPTFTIQERYIYDFYPFLKKLEQDFTIKGGGRAYLMDEATNLVSNRDWNKEDNKHMIQLLEMFRSRGLTLIMCIPSFDRLDVYIREHRARFKIECKDLPKGNKFGGRGYYELTILPNKTVGHGTFPIMSASDKAIYEGLKERSQASKLQEMIKAADPEGDEGKGRLKESNDRNKKMAAWFIIHEGWSYQDVSEQFGIPEGTLRRWIKEIKDDD